MGENSIKYLYIIKNKRVLTLLFYYSEVLAKKLIVAIQYIIFLLKFNVPTYFIK